MSSVTNRINLLRKGLVKVLRRGRPGEVVFCRCLNRQDVLELGADPELSPSGWSVCVVTDRANGAIRAITSDRAVELREEKGPPVLLLVDADHAGAGMDGIYSAGREIDEAALFKAIDELAKRELNEAVLLLAHEARRLSRKLYGRSAGARWDDLDFLASLVSSPESFGKALSLVGLWPIDGSLEGLGIRDIDSSMRLVQKLLLGFGREQTAGSRVRALFLKDATEGQRRLLEQMVEEAATKSIPDVVRDIAEHPTIWLNCIKPGFLLMYFLHMFFGRIRR